MFFKSLGDAARPFASHEHVMCLKDHVIQGKGTLQNKIQLRVCVRMAGMTSISNSKTLFLLLGTNIDSLEVIWGPGLRNSPFSPKMWSLFW